MGLFGFLKRKKEKEEPAGAGFEAAGSMIENELELPPPPPLTAHDIYSELPSLPGPQKPVGPEPGFRQKLEMPKPMMLPPPRPEAYRITPVEREIMPINMKESVPVSQHRQFEVPKPIEAPRQMPETPSEKLPELFAPEARPAAKPVALHRPAFVRAHDFRALLEGLNAAARIAKPGKGLPGSLNELRARENEKLDKWHQTLEDLQRNLVIIDQEIFER